MTGDRADEAARVDALVGCFNEGPVGALVRNLMTRVARIDVGGCPYPITINDAHVPENCYVCDPVTGYVDYAIEETRNFTDQPLLRSALVGLIRSARPLVRAAGLGRVVHLNNWLFSTNPAPRIDRAHAREIRQALVARFPGHGIVIRSLNTFADNTAIQALKEEGFLMLPSRQIYIFDGAAPDLRMTVDLKRDRRLLETTPFRRVPNDGIRESDYARAIALYDMLYLEKYTPLNPQYTALYLQRMHAAGLLQLEGLRDGDGPLVAIGGRFRVGRTLTQPIVGYDTGRPRTDGLYRLVTAMAQQDAIEEGLVFSMSAGAASFKRHRSARPALEYSAVYARHLGPVRRAALRSVEAILSGVGVPLLERFEL